MCNMRTIGPAVSEKKIFEIVDNDGRRTEHGYTISSPMSLRLKLCKNETPGKGLVCNQGAQLDGFILRIPIHCYTQNIKALCLAVSEKEFFPHSKSMGTNDPLEEAILILIRDGMNGFMLSSSLQCCIRNIQASAFQRRRIFKQFPGTLIGVFTKTITMHNINAPGFVVSEKNMFMCSHCKAISFGSVVVSEKIFFSCICHYKSTTGNDAP